MPSYMRSLGIDVESFLANAIAGTLTLSSYPEVRSLLDAVLIDRESRIDYVKVLKSCCGGKYINRQALPDDDVTQVLQSGLSSLDDDTIARLAVNPTAISHLSWEIAEQCPDYWMSQYDRLGEFYSPDGDAKVIAIAQHALTQASPDPLVRPVDDTDKRSRQQQNPAFTFGKLGVDDDEDEADEVFVPMVKMTLEEEINTFVATYWQRLYGFACRLALKEVRISADDILSDGFLKYLKARRKSALSFEPEREMRFMFACMRQAFIDRCRKLNRAITTVEEILVEAVFDTMTAASKLEKAEVIDTLRGCMERLSEKQRTRVVMVYLNALSPTDVARQLGVSLNAVRFTLRGALRNLYNCLSSKGILGYE